MTLPIKRILWVMIDVFRGIFRHHSNGSMSIASIFQEVKVVAELIFRIFGSWVTENSTGTSPHMGVAARVYVCARRCLQGVCGVGRVDVDAIGTIVPRGIDEKYYFTYFW